MRTALVVSQTMIVEVDDVDRSQEARERIEETIRREAMSEAPARGDRLRHRRIPRDHARAERSTHRSIHAACAKDLRTIPALRRSPPTSSRRMPEEPRAAMRDRVQRLLRVARQQLPDSRICRFGRRDPSRRPNAAHRDRPEVGYPFSFVDELQAVLATAAPRPRRTAKPVLLRWRHPRRGDVVAPVPPGLRHARLGDAWCRSMRATRTVQSPSTAGHLRPRRRTPLQ